MQARQKSDKFSKGCTPVIFYRFKWVLLARMVWGTYLEKNCPSSNGHLLDCGGVKMLARMVWGTYAVKIEVQMGICLC